MSSEYYKAYNRSSMKSKITHKLVYRIFLFIILSKPQETPQFRKFQ